VFVVTVAKTEVAPATIASAVIAARQVPAVAQTVAVAVTDAKTVIALATFASAVIAVAQNSKYYRITG